MTDFVQIIIGAGTSAYSFLYYAHKGAGTQKGKQFDPTTGKVLIVGKSDLWRDVVAADKEHKIGQPAHFLTLPGDLTPVPQPSNQFMSSKSYAKNVENLEQSLVKLKGVSVSFHYALATRIIKEGEVYKVSLTKPVDGKTEVTCKQVIIATPGPQSRPDSKVLENCPDDSKNRYKRVIDGVEYMNSIQFDVKTICINGSSATSSWAVKRAIAAKVKNIIWVGRSGFSEANPAGRNNDVIEEGLKNGWMCIGEITKVVVEDEFPTGMIKDHKPTVKITFGEFDKEKEKQAIKNVRDRIRSGASIYEAYKKALEKELDELGIVKVRGFNNQVYTLPIKTGQVIEVNQYVNALGASSLCRAINIQEGILSQGLADKLTPVYDVDNRFGDQSDDTVVAYTDGGGTADDVGGLWVVGAAVFRAGKEGIKYSNVTQMMPKNGHPPEGIASIPASIKAITGVYEDDKINFTTADFSELERWTEKLYQKLIRENATTLKNELGWASLPPEVLRFVADQIVALRRHTTFGMEHLATSTTPYEAITRTVTAMLSSKDTLYAICPENLLVKWKK